MRVYHGVGGNVEDFVERAHALHEAWGFTAFKTSPYQVDIEAERWGRVCSAAARFFEDVRNNTPDEWEIAFDPHARIFEPVRALQLANALAPYDPYFYEEPLRPEHLPAWSRLRSQMQVPLASGESLYTRFEFLELMAAQGADIIQPDVCVCGGLLEMRKIAAIAEAHYVTVAPHNPMGPLATAVNVHFAAATPNFKILEYVLHVATEWEHVHYRPLPAGRRILAASRCARARYRRGPKKPLRTTRSSTGSVRVTSRPDGSTGYI